MLGSREAVAVYLDVNSANIYNLLSNGKLSSTLETAIVSKGGLPPRLTRTRLGIDCEQPTREWFRAEQERRGLAGEALLLYMRRCMEREEGRI